MISIRFIIISFLIKSNIKRELTKAIIANANGCSERLCCAVNYSTIRVYKEL